MNGGGVTVTVAPSPPAPTPATTAPSYRQDAGIQTARTATQIEALSSTANAVNDRSHSQLPSMDDWMPASCRHDSHSDGGDSVITVTVTYAAVTVTGGVTAIVTVTVGDGVN